MITIQDRMLVEARVANDGPSTLAAYLLWLFFGLLSAHRFYLGRPGSAILQIVLNIALVGLVWVAIDMFLIPSMVRGKRDKIRQRLTSETLAITRS